VQAYLHQCPWRDLNGISRKIPDLPEAAALKPSDPDRARKAKLIATLVLAVLGFASMFATAVVFPNIGSFVRDRFLLTDAQASLFAAVYLAPHVVFAFIWGAVSDRIGKRKQLLVVGYLVTAVFHFLLPYAESFLLLLVLRFGEGVASILGFSMVMTRAMDLGQKSNYGRIMGLMGGSISLGTTLAFPVGGTIGAGSMYTLCSMGAVILVLCAIVAYWWLSEDKGLSKARSFEDALLVFLKNSKLRIPYLFTFIDRFTVGFFAVTFPLYAGSVHGIGASDAGLLLAGFLVPFSLLTYPVGKLVDRSGGLLLLLGGSMLYGVAVLFVGVISFQWILPLMVLCGVLASAMYAPSLWMVARYAPEEKRASAMGGFNAAGSIGFTIGPVVGGLVSDGYGYAAAFGVAGFSEILCVLLSIPFILKIYGPAKLSFYKAT